MKKIIYIFLFCLFTSILVFAWSEKPRNELESNLIRLHILANSNSSDDQQIKLKIRDAILDFSNRTNAVPDLNTMETVANRILNESNKPYRAKADFGKYTISKRDYENFSLPYGKYTAVRITLGNGKGQNWWCVLSPPMCFTKSVFGYNENLENRLSDETINIIDRKNINIKFKTLEIASKIAEKLGI